jgi:heat shock factor-binding protein 1
MSESPKKLQQNQLQQTGILDEDPGKEEDMQLFIKNLLEQMQNRFTAMSTTIIGRIDEMGSRIDDLEKSIGELMNQV